MQGSIAQVLSLVMTGNALLQGRPIGRFWPAANVFKFCRSVRFARPSPGSASPVILAQTPQAWLEDLRYDATGLRVHLVGRNDPGISDRMSVAFVGGGSRWLIEVLYRHAEPRLWQESWTLGDREAPDERIWDVVYWSLEGNSPPPVARDLADIGEDLRNALAALVDFAQRCGSHFASNFQAALAALDHGRLEGWYADLAPPGLLSPAAERLLAACQAGWVFGGMGSWNDAEYWGEFTEEGDRLSDRLFALLQEALVAAANSTSLRG